MTTTTAPSRLATLPVWAVSSLAGLAAAVVTELYGLAARGVGIPMRAGTFGATVAEPLPIGVFAVATVLDAALGVILAVLLARFASRPARAYLWTAGVLTVLSLAQPLTAGATAWSTKLTLALAHLIAAFIVIPVVARRLSHLPRRR
jgi:hypothetical protein